MAIRLASAVGQQRTPVDMYGGIGDAINKTGDAIQADMLRKQEADAKKKDQEQKYKDAIAATIEVTPPDRAFPEQKQEYETFAKRGVAELLAMSADPNKTPSEIKKKKDEIEYGLKDRLNVYREAYDAFEGVEEKRKDYDTGNFEAWFGGKTNPTQVASMPNDDFMAASEADRAGKMVGENGMQATETETSFQGKPYLNMTFEEQKAIPFRNKANELITLKKPNIVKAAQGYLGSDFKFGSLTKRTDKVSPTSGEYIYEFDEKGADELARKFASSVVGDGNFGSKEHSQYQRALEYEALRAGNEAGFSGDKLKEFVQEAVPRMAYEDFMRDARSAEAERSKNEKDITKQPSKGLEINFTSGGGASKGSVTIEPVKDFTPLDKAGIKKAEEQTAELKSSIKKAEEIAAKYKNNPSSPAYQNAKKSLDASNKALLDLEEENLKREEGFLMFSNKKAVDDAFIDINNDGKLMYRVIGFKPKADGGYNVLGVERVKTDEGKVDKIKNMDLTESVYKKIIAENPDADKVMNELGVKPSAKVAAPKKEAAKEVNIGFNDYVKAYEKAKGKKATPEVIEKLKIKFKSK